ncbi:hypothetical protein ACUNWD_20445 [Sunxiuqinia sp. A32]
MEDTYSSRAQKISWIEDYFPVFGTPFATSVELEKPAGTVV